MPMQTSILCHDVLHHNTPNIPSAMDHAIHKIIKNEDFKTHMININQITTQGGNYLSALFEVDVEGETEEGRKEINIFIKYVPFDDVSMLVEVNDVFLNEAFFYNELSGIYKKLQDDANIPIKERYSVLHSYKCDENMIVMENAARQGYKTLHRTETGSLRYNKMCIQQLAKFHALSFVLKQLRPKYFEEKIKVLRPLIKYDDNWYKMMSNMAEFTVKALEGENKQKIKDFVPVLLDKMPKYYTNNNTVVCCLCHTDYRPNNILMKTINGEVSHVIPVDYQTMQYGCPVTDFFYFISLATDRKLRQNHLNDLKNLYYDTIKKFLIYFDMDVENVYPRKEFERTYEERLDLMLMMYIIGIPFLHVSEDDVPNFDDLINKTANVDSKYLERIQEITDIIELCKL